MNTFFVNVPLLVDEVIVDLCLQWPRCLLESVRKLLKLKSSRHFQRLLMRLLYLSFASRWRQSPIKSNGNLIISCQSAVLYSSIATHKPLSLIHLGAANGRVQNRSPALNTWPVLDYVAGCNVRMMQQCHETHQCNVTLAACVPTAY